MKNYDIINLYKEGVNIDYISELIPTMTKEDVLKELNDFKKENMVGNRYSEEFKKVVAERDMCEVSRKSIQEELNISRSMVVNAARKYGKVEKNNNDDDMQYHYLEDGEELTKCPVCGGTHFNEVISLYKDYPVKGIYCTNCDNESLVYNKKIYKIDWEYVY